MRRSRRLCSVPNVDYTELRARTSWSDKEKDALANLLVRQNMAPFYTSQAFLRNMIEEGKVKHSIIIMIHPYLFSTRFLSVSRGEFLPGPLSDSLTTIEQR